MRTKIMALMTKFTRREVEDSITDPAAPLGCGGFGTVYRGRLRGLDVAIKVLDADSVQGQQEFDKEVLVLGSLHHPHLLPLLGSCPELHALVYPFMEKGSLQQRLYGRTGAVAGAGTAARAAVAPAQQQLAASAEPLMWWDRTRIAHETVLALMWLHGQQPPIWHMDVKPDNILLDRSNAAKLADVGIAKLHEVQAGNPTIHSTTIRIASTSLRGTPGFMAPEYLQYGRKGTFTDVYAAGVIMSQLLTGQEPCGSAESLKDAHDEHGSFTSPPGAAALQQLLDSSAGWPAGEAAQLAALAVSCLGGYSRRPKLDEVLEPALAALAQRGAGAAASAATSAATAVMPTVAAGSNSTTRLDGLSDALTCPICQDQFCDPVSTPGGITYCTVCILGWLNSGHATCPHTRQPLNANQLVPNYVARQVLQQLQQPPAPSAGSMPQAAVSTHSRNRQQPAAPVRSTAAGGPVSVAAAIRPEPQQPLAPQQREQQPPISQQRQQQPPVLHEREQQTPALRQRQPTDYVAQPVTWQAALLAARDNPDSIGAWELLGRCLSGKDWVDLQAAFKHPTATLCATAFVLHTAPYLASLKDLNFSHNEIGVVGVTALAKHASRHWPKLQYLYLGANNLGAAGVEALAQHAAHWPQLRHLDLHANNLGVAGVEALAKHAAHWPQLLILDLSDNNLGVAGVEALARAARFWPQLQSLDLFNNNVGVDGVEVLAHAARNWPQLGALYVGDNNMSDNEMAALEQCVEQQSPRVANALSIQ